MTFPYTVVLTNASMPADSVYVAYVEGKDVQDALKKAKEQAIKNRSDEKWNGVSMWEAVACLKGSSPVEYVK